MQATEFDEFSYQEMISFLPLNSHPNPEKVLIIGGGDGGVARECTKHPLVKEIYQCEIDSVSILMILVNLLRCKVVNLVEFCILGQLDC